MPALGIKLSEGRNRYGRSQKKNIALAAWHAPLGGRTEEADLCRGQGFRRTAPSAPPRPEDRHVQGPAGAEKEGILIGFRDKARLPAASARIWPTSGANGSIRAKRCFARGTFRLS